MKIIIGNTWYPTLQGDSAQIVRSATDPVPTCTLHLRDNTSTLNPQPMQEILVIDDQLVPNPTANYINDPALQNIGSQWTTAGVTGVTTTQLGGGGGAMMTCTNVASGTHTVLQAGPVGAAAVGGFAPPAGQTYTLSASVQGSSTPTNLGATMLISWLDGLGNIISQTRYTGPVPVSTTLTRVSISSVVPANTARAIIGLGVNLSSSTNSGAITWTQVQFEPQWFSTLAYPTPFCGPGQPNCQILPLGQYIRQYRKFAGFVNHSTAQDYHGNVRTLQVDAVGYAWLMGTILANDSFTNQTDALILSALLNKYLLSSGTAMLSTTNVVTGVTVSSLQSNWDDLRSLFDGLAGLSGFYWTVDPYWNMIYAPPGYTTMPISLICDNSSQPDMVTTFPAYNFSAESDITQPGCVILVLGNGSNVSEVISPTAISQLAASSGYTLPSSTSWMRKVNDSTLNSTADCTQRGMAELLQYGGPRNLYHLTTNVELIPGDGIPITSATDGLNASTQLIQQTTATWIGTDETLKDVWEYASDLGAVNRAATNMISRIFRKTQSGTSAPAIAATTLAAFENVSVNDTIDSNSLYAQTVLADSPIGYYRLGEPAGFSITTAYDWGGSAFNGTYGGGFTLGQPGALYNDSNTAVLFNGSTGKVDLAAGLSVTGLSAVTLEAWVNLSTTTFTLARVLSNDHTSADNKGCELIMSSNATGATFTVGNGSTFLNLAGSFTFSAGTWYHIVATWSASGGAKIYVNGTSIASGSLSGTIAAPTNSMGIAYAPATNANFFPGALDEVAVYSSALSQSRITAHYNVGTLGHP